MDDQVDDASDELTADLTITDGIAVVCLAGEIDIATRDVVASACRDAAGAGASRVVLDMSAVTFMDSSGLAALIDTRSTIAVVLRKPSDAVLRLLSATGLSSTFEVEP